MTPEEREDWLNWRRPRICASDIGAILGLSLWASPWTIWADKTGLISGDVADLSDNMKAGIFFEQGVARWFEHETGLFIAGSQMRCEHPTDKLAGATPDGFIFDGPVDEIDVFQRVEGPTDTVGVFWGFTHPTQRAPIAINETKVTGPGKKWTEIPEHYQAQAQWQMYVTGLNQVTFTVVRGGQRLDIHELKRNQADIDFMVVKAHEFWTAHVVTQTPPPVDDHHASLQVMGELWSKAHVGKSADISEVERAFADYRRSKAQERAAKKSAEVAKARIAAVMQDAEIATVGDVPVATFREQSRHSVAYEALHKAHPEIAEEFDNPSTFRVLREIKKAS